MRAHMEAVKARLEASGRQVYLVDVPEGVTPTYPYYLIWSTTGIDVSESLADCDEFLNDQIGVTNVGLTPEAVWSAANKSRALLKRHALAVEGHKVEPLKLTDARAVQPDRDVTLTNTNRHPYFGVDLYRLVSEPVAPVVPTP